MKFLKKLSLTLLSFHNLISFHVGAGVNFYSNEWVQISPHVEFQRYGDYSSPRNQAAEDTAYNRILSEASINPSYIHQPLDSAADYDEYQLAWRLLGFYIDCQSSGNDGACKRQVLYEVYANPYYRGGGIGEYAYYDKNSSEWLCYQYSNCITKMDCHEPDTQWKLLGVFKIDNISEGDGWMEQLFKHQGVCLWGDDTYKFASQMRRSLPNGCKATGKALEDGTYLYYGTKPEKEGNITLGLYTDSKCSQEYVGEESYDVFQLSGTDESNWISFNEALDIYKQCQPCISYDLSVSGFDCYDDAGYTNCNQCMKFSNKAGCKVAGMDDLILAAKQGKLVTFNVNGVSYDVESLKQNSAPEMSQVESHASTVHFRVFAALFFCFGLAAFVKTATTKKHERRSMKKVSEALLEEPEEDFKATKKMQVRLMKHMYESYEKAKMSLVYFGNDGKSYKVKKSQKKESKEDNVETFIAVDQTNAQQTSAEHVAPPAKSEKTSSSKKSFVSKIFKKLSNSISPIENLPVAVHPSENPTDEELLKNDLQDDATASSKDSSSRREDGSVMKAPDSQNLSLSETPILQPTYWPEEEEKAPFDENSDSSNSMEHQVI